MCPWIKFGGVVSFVLVAFLLAACAGMPSGRPGLACNVPGALMPIGDRPAEAERGTSPFSLSVVESMEGPRAPGEKEAGRALLALSGGGQWGAYGAGFLAGWSNHGAPRPDFQVVTGVSTGALIAPFAFLGTARDDDLLAAFTIKKESDLVKARGLAAILLGANSLLRRDGLEQRIADTVDERFLADIVTASVGGRVLVIGIVNADDGRFYGVDLVALARAGREDCFEAFLLASTSVPVAFPPVFINGHMYIDGGARQTVFFHGLTSAIAAMPAAGPASLNVVVNGDLAVMEQETENSLLGIANRASTIVVDQLDLDSLERLIDLARANGWTARYTTARGAQAGGRSCAEVRETQDGEQFNPTFMACLMQHGQDRWSADRPWDGTAP